MTNNTEQGMIIPIHLDGLLVTQDDYPVVGPNADFSELPYEQDGVKKPGPYLGERVNPKPFEGVVHADKGMHLHWALPDALTEAVENAEGAMVFPAVPDRWLIVRTISNVNTLQYDHNCWIVESNHVTRTSEPGSATIPLLTYEDDAPKKSFGYLGRKSNLEGWTDQQPLNPGAYTDKLKAVGYGTPNFAAYYPNSRNVFGCLDPWDELAPTLPENARLTYTVIGWYADLTQDPIASSSNKAKTCEDFGWGFKDGSGSPDDAGYTLFYAVLHNVDTDKAKAEPPHPPTITPNVALGQTNEEALSVFLSKHVTSPEGVLPTEDILNALQLNLLHTLGDNPTPNAMMQLEEQQLQNTFESAYSGDIWAIEALESEPPNQPKSLDMLPPEIAEDLNALNADIQQHSLGMDRLQTLQWSTYASWVKYMLKLHGQGLSEDDINGMEIDTAIATLNQNDITATQIRLFMLQQGEHPGELEQAHLLHTEMDALQQHIDTQHKALEDALPDGFRLVKTPSSRYWQPAEPSVLLEHDHIFMPSRYGSDRGPEGHDTLPCVLSSALVTRITFTLSEEYGGQAYHLDADQFPHLPDSDIPHPSDIQALMAQTVFLTMADYLGSRIYLQMEEHHHTPVPEWSVISTIALVQNALLKGDSVPDDTVTFSGVFPDVTAFKGWNAQLWLPLMLQWQVNYGPLGIELGGEPKAYDPDFFKTHRLKSDTPTALLIEPPEVVRPDMAHIKNETLLSARDKALLTKQIDDFMAAYPDSPYASTLKASRDILENSQITTITLSGMLNAMISRKKAMQLPVHDPIPNTAEDDLFSNHIVPTAVDTQNTLSPMLPDGTFCPLRMGLFYVSKLRVIDAFGQFVDVKVPSAQNVMLSKPLIPPDAQQNKNKWASLQPKFAQAARPMMRWLSAENGSIEMNAHPLTNPICGWVMVNAVDYGIDFYDGHGNCIGAFVPVGEGNGSPLWQPAPGGPVAPGPDTFDACFKDKNDILVGLAKHVKNMNSQVFNAFITTLDKRAALLEPQNYRQDVSNAFFVGRPLAITRMQLTLDFMGNLACYQSWNALQQQLDAGNPSLQFNAGLDNLSVPTLLGACSRIDDGMVGYFNPNHDPSDPDFSVFYSESADDNPEMPSIRKASSVTLMLQSRATHNPLYIVSLIDPRSNIYLPTGSFFPVKAISLPDMHYKKAMDAISLSLLTSPVIVSAADFQIPLPKAEGGHWAWVTTGKDQNWEKTPLQNDSTSQGINYSNNLRLEEGWLTFDKNNEH